VRFDIVGNVKTHASFSHKKRQDIRSLRCITTIPEFQEFALQLISGGWESGSGGIRRHGRECVQKILYGKAHR
jgi:aspartyl-tRNA synthetase